MGNYINKLHVANIGIFNFLDIEFSPDVNIIIGTNSTGKTSILKCITYCLSNFHLDYTRFRNNAEYWIDFSKDDNQYRAGTQKVVDVDQGYRHFEAKRWNNPPNEGVDGIFLPHGNVPFNLFAIGAHRYFDYHKINGMQREAKGNERKRYYDQNNSSFLENPSLPAIKQWMINRYFIIEKDWANIENSNWKRVIDFLPKIVSSNQKFEFLRIERDLEPMFSLNNSECYLEELSGGFKSILSVIFSIIDWCEGVNEGELGLIENASGTVLIDEIDAHLHPEWQMTIVSNLKALFPKLQFIITTHSPHVISSANENEIIRIPVHFGDLDLKPFDKSYKGWQIKNILEDLMGVTEIDEIYITKVLTDIENAINEKDIEKFDQEFDRLKVILHPSDSILKLYEIKRSKVFL